MPTEIEPSSRTRYPPRHQLGDSLHLGPIDATAQAAPKGI
jgi:hypothetical protein